MCRWAMYLGPEIPLSWLLTDPEHSIIHQSYRAELREEPLNGDGFGVAWYARNIAEPAVFRSIQPAWNNTNLIDLARVTSSSTILAHVRAATPGLGVQEANCHPFKRGPLTFMHNGNVDGFLALKRGLLEALTDDSFDALRGNTDSEHIFALFMDALPSAEGERACDRYASALRTAVEKTCALADAIGAAGTTYLNLAVSDGEQAAACRFVHNGPQAHSLFVMHGKRYLCDADGVCHLLSHDGAGATLIASEPLADDDSWSEVPHNHVVLVPAAGSAEVAAF
jgi:glutamine amidotransferase